MNLATIDRASRFDAVADFASRELDPETELEGERTGQFDRGSWQRLADFGLLASAVPEEDGGLGFSCEELVELMEGVGHAVRDQGLLLSIHAHLWAVVRPLCRFGNDAQKERYLPGLIDGRSIAANAISEREAGSDAFALRTTATRDGDGFVIDGEKTFVTNAPIADLVLLYARTDPDAGVLGLTAFLVEGAAEGIDRSVRLEKMGLRSSPMGELGISGSRVETAAVLGREGRGAAVFEFAMDWERTLILATALGVMRRQIADSARHARERRQFGKPLKEFQSVTDRIANMQVRLAASRSLLLDAARAVDRGDDARGVAAAAKLFASESFVTSSLDAMRILGGRGYLVEYDAEQTLRDAIGALFYSGTSDILRRIIVQPLGL